MVDFLNFKMETTVTGLIIPSFIAGVLTFLAPCTLPLVPAYLGFVSGASLDDLKDPEKAKSAKRKILLNSIFFVAGFSAIFILLGALAGFAGAALAPFRIWMARLGGVLVILFGLSMTGIIKIPLLTAQHNLKIPPALTRGNVVSSAIIGASFGFGWTPCAGPILGSILLLASTSATMLQGAFLLTIFSLGLAIPFIAIALGIGSASNWIAKFSKYLKAVEITGGLFLIGLGFLLLTNNMGLLISYGFRILDFINYEAILDYL